MNVDTGIIYTPEQVKDLLENLGVKTDKLVSLTEHEVIFLQIMEPKERIQWYKNKVEREEVLKNMFGEMDKKLKSGL